MSIKQGGEKTAHHFATENLIIGLGEKNYWNFFVNYEENAIDHIWCIKV